MAEHDIDPRFEGLLEERLRAYSDEALRPFDAVEIAHRASAGGSAGGSAAAGLPRRLRWLALPAGAVALLLVAVLASNLLPLPDRQVGPDPTGAAALSPAPGEFTGPPIIDPNLSPLPASPPPVSTGAPATAAAGGPDEPGPAESTAQPTAEPTAEPVGPSPSPEPPTAAPPTAEPTLSPPASPTPAPLTATSIAAGSLHFCAVLSDRTITCWGDNSEGELGDGTRQNRWTTGARVAGIDDARQVATGTRFSCALRDGGSVWCWGAGIQGDGGSTTPVRVAGISNATAVTAGAAHACALRASGRVSCWGLGSLGQLGNGSIVHNEGNPPVDVAGLTDVLQISAGWNHTCAVRAEGSAWCWGGNGDGATGYGQIGDGTQDNAPSPVQVSGLSNVQSVAAGGWSSCALLANRTVWCWGYGERGGLGNGTTTNSSTPVQVADMDNARQVDVGGWHACALRAAGRVSCWGANSHGNAGGQLGDGTRTDRSTPVRAFGVADMVQVSAGWIDTCVLGSDGAIGCWGHSYGQTWRPVNTP